MDISMQMNHYYKVENLKSNYNRKLKLPMFQTISMQISERKNNYYELLSLKSQNADLDEIKKAYKSLALRYHPDVSDSSFTKEEWTRKFIELREAYETLSDPNSRRMYDYELGLAVNSFELGFGWYDENSRDRHFSREVWERQLVGLRMRSSERMKNKDNN